MDYQAELKRQAEMLAQQKAQSNPLGLDPSGMQNLGQALTGETPTAPAMMPVKDLGQDPAEQQTLIAKLKALMGQGQ